MVDVRSERTEHRAIPAGIIVPLKVRDKAVGTLKFYYRRSHDVNRTQYALASGFAELLSTQLAIHELELQDELTARAELRALQAQINPHFLFNTLNTIASLTRTEPLRARELLREFSSFYRATLENSGSLIPVSREVAQTSRYLVFEKARFGEDRIRERFEIAPDAQDLPVPAFIIQPLVENAVRHGMTDEGPLTIEVSVSVPEQGFVLIEVADDGAGMDERTAARLFSTGSDTPAERAAADRSAPSGGGAGVAMRNISERIERFYGPRSSISANASETLAVFDGLAEAIAGLELTEEELDGYILSALSSYGKVSGVLAEPLAAIENEIMGRDNSRLAETVNDMKHASLSDQQAAAAFFAELLENASIATVGNEAVLKAEAEAYDSVISYKEVE